MPHSYMRSVHIRCPQAVVFAFLSDLRNELAWNPDARSIEMLTGEPLGVGTTFRAAWKGAPRALVEVTSYDPPTTWATRTSSMGMDVRTTGHVEAAPDGATFIVRIEVAAAGLARLLVPLAVRMMERQEAQNVARIKAALESST